MSYEQLRVLEKRAMARIRVDDQLSPGDSLRKIVRIDRRYHDVVISINDEGRLHDVLELRVAFSAHLAPGNDCRSLSGHGLRRTRAIRVTLTKMPPLPKRFASGLAGRRRAKEQVEEGLERALSGLGIR